MTVCEIINLATWMDSKLWEQRQRWYFQYAGEVYIILKGIDSFDTPFRLITILARKISADGHYNLPENLTVRGSMELVSHSEWYK